MKKGEIKNVLDSMIESIDTESIILFKKLVDEKCYDSVTTPSEVFHGLIYPFEQYLSGLVKAKISDNTNVEFLIINYNFIENHFVYWFEKIEGPASCSDKSSTIIKQLINFYKTGERIEFNYTQEYTFHLPNKIFKTHDEIVLFYESVRDLRYGNPGKYILELQKLMNPNKSH